MNPQKLKPLRSVEHALQVLEDNKINIRERTGAARQMVFDWKRQDHFPSTTFCMMAPLFMDLGYDPTPRLWQQRTEPYSHGK